jgi:nucleotide-binding universal stress UspA family protein
MRPTLAIQTILCPTDLSPTSDRATEHAGALAARLGATLTLYHAVEEVERAYARWGLGGTEEAWERTVAACRATLAERAAALAVPHEVVVDRTDSPPRAILQQITARRPDLTVMATHGRQALSHLLVGSVTERVVRGAFRPVLCLRPPEHGTRFPYRRILVPSDLSPASRLAFPLAALLAREFAAAVLAVYVQTSRAPAQDTGGPRVPTEAWLWRFFQPDFTGLDLTAQVVTGAVWDRIVHVARVERADVVVMSTRGHDSLGDRILGSNTERVVRHSPCPVLVA